jgi:hypothetical protein
MMEQQHHDLPTRALLWLFAKPSPDRRVSEVIFWWEKRRLFYNLILIVFCACSVFGFETSGGVVGVILVICSNIWYTGGWIAELLLRLVTWDRMLWFAPVMLGVGIVFSFAFSAYWLFVYGSS